MTTREEVYRALDSERNYQSKWDTTEMQGQHEIESFMLYMYDYLDEARCQVSRGPIENTRQSVLATIRKVTALGVACMEQHGAPQREGFEVA